MIHVEISQQVMSILPLDPLLPGASPPDRRAALELRMAQLRAAPALDCTSQSSSTVNSTPVSTETGEGQTRPAGGCVGRPLLLEWCPLEESLSLKHFLRAAVLPVALATGSAAFANDIQFFQTVLDTDFVSAGVGGLRGVGSGTINLAGVSGPVSQAYLYWHGPETALGNVPGNSNIFVNGMPVTGQSIGLSSNNCWGFAVSHAYRADVTGLVTATGNGNYNLTGMGTASIGTNGASLIAFFDDGDNTNYFSNSGNSIPIHIVSINRQCRLWVVFCLSPGLWLDGGFRPESSR